MGEVVVLWVSKHVPLPAQVGILKSKLGNVRVVQMGGIIPNAEAIIKRAKSVGAKYIVPVLPLSMIIRLLEEGNREFIVLYARMNCIAVTEDVEYANLVVAENPAYRTIVRHSDGKYRVFEFVGFDVLKDIKIVTEPW